MPHIEYGEFVKFSFYKLRRDCMSLPDDVRMKGLEEFCGVMDEVVSTGRMTTYSTVGTRADVDFLTVLSSANIQTFHDIQASINRTFLGSFLEQPHSYLSVRRRTQYKHGGNRDIKKDMAYFIIYPMVKKREWYALSLDERQRIMNEHFRVGKSYPGVKINTTYSFGLDDPEFVVGFEMDDPSEFVSLVMELRETLGAQYTASETPIFTSIRMPMREILIATGV